MHTEVKCKMLLQACTYLCVQTTLAPDFYGFSIVISLQSLSDIRVSTSSSHCRQESHVMTNTA